MVEKKIYSMWAFQDNAAEKRQMNSVILKELNEKYKINTNGLMYNEQLRKFENINLDNYDCEPSEMEYVIKRRNKTCWY